MDRAYSLNEVLLVPQHSLLHSRSDVVLSIYWPQYHETQDDNYIDFRLPILSAPMDTVTGIDMQKAMLECGARGIHHRYCDKETLLRAVEFGPIAVAPSLGIDFLDDVVKIGLQLGQTPIVVCDVAHGDSLQCIEYAKQAIKRDIDVVSGNICTPEAAIRYLDAGIIKLRVGVGSGGACTTRTVAGVGVPMFTAIQSISEAIGNDGYIIADGGIHTTGTIVKALAAGADFVILGKMLAGATETPGKRVGTKSGFYTYAHDSVSTYKTVKEFRGMASIEALDEAGKERNVEGVSMWVDEAGSLKDILTEIENGLRAGFAYCGAYNIEDLHKLAQFIVVRENNGEGAQVIY